MLNNSKFLKSCFVYLILCLFFISCFNNENNNDRNTEKKNDKKADDFKNNTDGREHFSTTDLSYNGQKVKVSKHGRCRMECRNLDAYEIQEVINKGRKNPKKSNSDSKPCPTIALEGMTADGQNARVVLGLCDGDYKIVTVIDLKNDWKCDCY
jgi:hypothetical protein